MIAGSCLAEVNLLQRSDRVVVLVDGKAFGSLYFGADANKPFFHPLTTPKGIRVTRSFPLEKVEGEPTDHPHQKGLWVGTERLSGMDLWENDSSYTRPRMGRILFQDVTRSISVKERGELAFRADWISPEGKLLVVEQRAMTFHAGVPGAHVMDVDLTLTAREAVTFEDHQDAIIGVRLAPGFDEKNGGMAINAEGFRGEAGIRGRASRYVDWRATLQGNPVGVAILDHPDNLNAPARWHIRSFGFFTANPFARRAFDPAAPPASKTVRSGETLRLRYRVVVYDGKIDIESCWQEFAGRSE
ncbi:PmoA family protein [Paludibaculum fermentans]|uniref:DUF6807 domain-containing protein n=1 Tax=Paludibaculum fermentans TaxID=1473598 RepID=UPI003EC0FAB6